MATADTDLDDTQQTGASAAPSARARVRRLPARGAYDARTIAAILDECLIGQIGFIDPALGHPVVIPTLIARAGGEALFHTSRIARLAEAARVGEICLSATLADGLVLAKSAFHHSMNYRSVVAFGRAREILDPEAKSAALRAFTDKLVPGRWDQVRAPNPKELGVTAVFALDLAEASAKARTGGPVDDEEDLALPVTVGVIPLRLVADPMVET